VDVEQQWSRTGSGGGREMKTNECEEKRKSKMCSAKEMREKLFVLGKREISSQYQSNQIESFDFFWTSLGCELCA
jgi:hypothetical protein